MVWLLRKKADRLFFSRLVCGFVVLFVEAKCWVIWFVLAPGEIENKNKFKDPLNDCACFFILHVPLGKRVGPPVGYQIKTYFTIWKNFRYTLYLLDVFLLALMLFLFGFPCRRDIIGQAGSHMVVVKESCSVVWTDSLQSCCSTPRCLYFCYFWRLTSAEGKKKGQRIIVPISTPVTKCFGFYRRPWGHGSGGSSGPPSVTYVGKQPLPRLQCSNSLPSRSKQNLLRVASVKSTSYG